MAATKVNIWAACRSPCSAAVEVIFGTGKQIKSDLQGVISALCRKRIGQLEDWKMAGYLIGSEHWLYNIIDCQYTPAV